MFCVAGEVDGGADLVVGGLADVEVEEGAESDGEVKLMGTHLKYISANDSRKAINIITN